MNEKEGENVIEKKLRKQALHFIKFSKLLQSWMMERGVCGIKIQDGDYSELFTQNICLCPFCKSNFLAFSGDQRIQNAYFTLDHYPPESVGGKQVCLVCESCNKGFGAELDHCLKKNLQLQSFVNQGKEKVNASFKYSGIRGNFKGKVFWDKENFIMELPISKYPPVKEWMLNDQKEGSTVEFLLNFPNEPLLKRAMLRISYLICFESFGYDFIFDTIGVEMNKEIRGDEKNSFLFQLLESEQEYFTKIVLVTEPAELSCVLVPFTVGLRDVHQYLNCVLPMSNSTADVESARKFVEIIRNDSRVHFHHIEL